MSGAPLPPSVHLEETDWARAVIGLVAGLTPMAPVGLTLGPHAIDVHFDGPAPGAPSPFRTTGPSAWTLRRSTDLLGRAETSPDRTSGRCGLVTAWHHEASRFLIETVACGSLAIDGPPVAVGTTLCDAVVELATRRWSEIDEVVVVGFGRGIDGLGAVVCLPDVEAALAHVWRDGRAAEISRCVVVAPCLPARGSAPDALAKLLELANATPATGVICCDPSAPTRVLWRLSSHRETLDVTFRTAGVLRLQPPPVTAPHSQHPPPAVRDITPPCPDRLRHAATDGAEPGAANGVTVRLLGDVDVVGTAAPLGHRPRVTELVVYLSLHPQGSSGEAIASAVWPDRRVPAQTLANRLSEARRALGPSLLGGPRLTRVAGRHVLAEDVRTDLDVFRELVGRGDAEALGEALSLVRGRPFAGLSDSGWTLLEGFVSEAESMVVETACRLSQLCLETGDTGRAAWAVRRGLVAAPWDELLYRQLMRVQHASGNRGGIDAALRGLAGALELTGDPLVGVSPDTARLYRELTARSAG